VSGPEGVALSTCPADIIELAAFRTRAAGLGRLADEQSIPLPGPGAVRARSGRLVVCVRPGRWLLLGPRASPGASSAYWQEASGGRCAVVDLSAALAAFQLAGTALEVMLARGCRLDLEASAFPAGCAAATIMVQVPVILARLTSGMLLLTPATTARHLHEWLVTTSQAFGLTLARDAAVSKLHQESST
jgi:sarcosine oxidase subunit gamma